MMRKFRFKVKTNKLQGIMMKRGIFTFLHHIIKTMRLTKLIHYGFELKIGDILIAQQSTSICNLGAKVEIVFINSDNYIRCHGLSGMRDYDIRVLNELRKKYPEGCFGIPYGELNYYELKQNDWDD